MRTGAGREHGERAQRARGQVEGSEEEGEGDSQPDTQLFRHQPRGCNTGSTSQILSYYVTSLGAVIQVALARYSAITSPALGLSYR